MSFFVETGEEVYLFDTGASGMVVSNADALGIDLSRIDAVVLSHGHYDHTGGLLAVLKRIGRDLRVIAHPSIFDQKYHRRRGEDAPRYVGIPHRRDLLEDAGARFELHEEPVRLSEGVVASGVVPLLTEFERVSEQMLVKSGDRFLHDQMADDQSLYVETDRGLAVILGCAHRGMINSIRHGQRLADTEVVYLVIGGTHLAPAEEDQVTATIAALKELEVQRLGPSHCTGLPVAARLAAQFGERFFFATAGTTIQHD